MYVDIGANNGDSATLNFNFMGTNTARTWDIKVTQVECSNPNAWVGTYFLKKNSTRTYTQTLTLTNPLNN